MTRILLSPLRGLWRTSYRIPWAYAQGYVLPSLCDDKTAQFHNLRVVQVQQQLRISNEGVNRSFPVGSNVDFVVAMLIRRVYFGR